jgi:hypothetical protein
MVSILADGRLGCGVLLFLQKLALGSAGITLGLLFSGLLLLGLVAVIAFLTVIWWESHGCFLLGLGVDGADGGAAQQGAKLLNGSE